MIKNNLRLYGFYAVCACSFFLQLSTAGISICSSMFILCWIWSGAIKDVPEILRKYPTALISTLLFLMFVAGAVYSPVEGEVILDVLKEYRILLYVPIIMCLCNNRDQAAKYFLNSFLAGSVIALVASYLFFFDILPHTLSYKASGYNSIISPNLHSGLMALLTYLLIHKLIRKEKNAVYGIPIIVLAFFNVLFLIGSSTGIVILVVLMSVLILQCFSIKLIIPICIALSVMIIAVYNFSPKLAHEVNEIVDTVQNYEIGSGTMHNNASLRLDWWLSSYWLIKEKPLLGYGTGAFEQAHDDIIKGTNIQPRPHPHNEYLYTGVQIGLVGMVLFVLLIAAPFYASLKFKPSERYVLQGILIFFALGNMFEGWLLGSASSILFVMAVAVYVANPNEGALKT